MGRALFGRPEFVNVCWCGDWQSVERARLGGDDFRALAEAAEACEFFGKVWPLNKTERKF